MKRSSRGLTRAATLCICLAVTIGNATLRAQPTTLISVEPDGTGADSHCSSMGVSRDGRYVAFDSAANISGGQVTGLRDVYLRDRQLAVTTRISLSWNGQYSNSNSTSPAFSTDARYIVYSSDHPNIVPNDTNGFWSDVFLYDRTTGQTELISVSSSEVQGDYISSRPAISGTGRYVAFGSRASNLVPGDGFQTPDVFVRDRVNGTTTLVSATPASVPGNGGSDAPAISDDGQWIVFNSDASNLVAGDTNNTTDIFLRDMQTGTTTRITGTFAGGNPNSYSFSPHISGDGSKVAFISNATNLVAGDTNGFNDVFVYDVASGTIDRVSVDSQGQQANGDSQDPHLSAEASRIAYCSIATNLVTGDTNSRYDVFVQEIQTGDTIRVSVATDGTQGNNHSGERDGAKLSQGGALVVFNSQATNFSPADTNSLRDVYARELPTGGCTPAEILSNPAGQAICVGDALMLSVTADGSPAPTYEWRRDGQPIPGASQATYTIPSASSADAGTYDVTVSNPCGVATSSSAVVSVGTQIDVPPASQTGCTGSSVTFTVQAAGPAPITYQWRKSGAAISGATSSSLTLDPLAAGDAGPYDVVATSPCGSTTSAAATLTMIPSVAINQHPQNQTICVASPFTLSVSATGGGALHYQWRQNGQNVGGDSPTYSVTQAFEFANGTYEVIVSNECSSATSNSATVIVSSLPFFTKQPLDIDLCEGGQVTLTTTVTSAAPITYQWRKNGADIPGATQSSLMIDPALPEHTGAYQCIATNVCGPRGSDIADIMVEVAPVILDQPASTSICIGPPITFTVIANGNPNDPPLTYQWRKDEIDIDGATSSEFTLASVTLGDAGSYDVVITNDCGATTSEPGILAVVPEETPTITQQPTDQTGCQNGTATFTVTAAGTSLAYQWQSASDLDPNTPGVFQDIAGATSATYVVDPVVPAAVRNYRVRISNFCSEIFSVYVRLRIDDGNLSISTHPQDTTVCEDGTLALFAGAGGTPPFTFRWRKGGVDIPGANDGSLFISPVSAADAGSYDVVVQSLCGGMATSDSAIVTVVPNAPPQITLQPPDTTACEGSAVTLTVSASGSAPLAYAWRRNGVLLAGQTSTSLSFSSVQPADEGFYDVLVSNPCGQTQSLAASLVVDDLPLIWRHPKNRVAAAGESITIFVDAVAPLPLIYQWRKNGVDIPGETQSELTLVDVQPADEADYDVIVSNSCGSVTSTLATLSRVTTPQTHRVNLTTDDIQADQDSSTPSIDGAGRFVAFESTADSLLSGPGDNFVHVFLRDRQSARLTQIDAAPGDGRADADSHGGVMSTDERWIAFESDATNIVPSDTNGVRDVFLLDDFSDQSIRISVGPGGAQANGPSREPAIAMQASRIAFTSDASNLVPGDTNGVADVFVYERATGTIQRISVDSGGGQSNGASDSPAISDNARYVVYSSVATNLVIGDTNGAADVFLRDLENSLTIRVSVSSAGAQADGESLRPCISADGTSVGFESVAGNLVPGDTNLQTDVFAHDVATGQVRRINLGPAAAQADNASVQITLSRTGRYAAFLSAATNLVAGDTNGFVDAFLLDRDPDADGEYDEGDGVAQRVSVADGSGFQSNQHASWAYIGSDGSRVLFASTASNLVDDDTNGASDIFMAQPVFGATTRLSATNSGEQAAGASLRPTISGNSQYVVFASFADNLAANDRNAAADIFTRNIQLNQTELRSRAWRGNANSIAARLSADGRFVVFQSYADIFPAHGPFAEIVLRNLETDAFEAVSTNAAGVAATDNCFTPRISGDGRFVAFASPATNLVPGVSGLQTYLKDRQSGVVELISVNISGNPGGTQSEPYAVSADGRHVVFTSLGADFVLGDTNGRRDVFVRDRQTQSTVRASLSNTGAESNRDCTNPAISADGQLVAFETAATNFSAVDTNAQTDVYLRDLAAATTTLISATPAGTAGNDGSGAPALSADGLLVFFHSNATNLIPADTSPFVDVYVHDRASGQTRVVSIDSLGQQGAGGESTQPAASDDGRYVAFASSATNLVSGDTNGRRDIFVHDSGGCLSPEISDQPDDITVFIGQNATFNVAATGTPTLAYQWRKDSIDIPGANGLSLTIVAPELDDEGAYDVVVTNDCGDMTSIAAFLTVTPCSPITEAVSISAPSAQSFRESAYPSLSANGRYVAFHSPSDNMVPQDNYGFSDIFVRDRLTSHTVQITVPATGAFANASSYYPAISPDGRFVAFQSQAGNLITGDSNGGTDVFVRDRDPDGDGVFDDANAMTTRVSVKTGGAQCQGGGGDYAPGISADGRFVAFESGANDIVPGLPNGIRRIYVHDRQTVTTQLVSIRTNGQPSGDDSWHASISADGRHVAFRSRSNDLVANDTNISDDIFVFDRQTGVTALVSLTSAGAAANDMSWWPKISADGRFVSFVSRATNLVAGDTNGVEDVFVRDLVASTTVRVSVGPGGVQSNGLSRETAISADGGFIAYYSNASNLVPGDSNGVRDAFVYDRVLGVTQRVSVQNNSVQGNGETGAGFNATDKGIAISADGGLIGSFSQATNLVVDDTNNTIDVFIHNIEEASSVRASLSDSGVTGSSPSTRCAISAGGEYVVFLSAAPNLVPGDSNGSEDVFLRDRLTGETLRVNVSAAGIQTPPGHVNGLPSISAHGRFIGFRASFDGLVPGDSNGRDDIIAYDRQIGALALISVATGGAQGNHDSGSRSGSAISFSTDGRFVVFTSDASNFVTGDSAGTEDVFLRDRDPDADGVYDETDATTACVSVALATGLPSGTFSTTPSISGDGRYVAFVSPAANLITGDNNNVSDVFVRDMQTGVTARVSVGAGGVQGNGFSDRAMISSDGRYVAFISSASNLVAGDTNNQSDVFVHDRQTGTTARANLSAAGAQVGSGVEHLSIAADGRYVAFTGYSSAYVPNDTNSWEDVFVRDLVANTTTRVSVSSTGTQGNRGSYRPAISHNGDVIAFVGESNNLIATATRAAGQIFVHERSACFGAVVLNPPLDQTVNVGERVNVTVAANGFPPPRFQWRRDGADIPNAVGPSLTFEFISLADAGTYTVVVSNELGELETSPAEIIVLAPCPGDVNGDRIVNLADLSLLLSHFGTLSGATLADGDFDGDGDVDLGDLTNLLSRFGTSCP